MSDETGTEKTTPTPGPGHPHKERSLRCLCSSMFHGPLAWLSVVGVIYGVLFLAGAIFTGIMFFRVDSTRAMIGYATLFALSSAFMAMTEMWFWNMMWRNSLAMRIDRLECDLAHAKAPPIAEHVEKPGQAA